MTVKLIHKHSNNAYTNASSTDLEFGEIAVNNHESGPYLQVKGTDGNVYEVGGIYYNTHSPTNPLQGKFWLDQTTDQLRVWNGTAWVICAGVSGPAGPGFTGGSYDPSTGQISFTSDDGIGFTTGDLRGADGDDGAGFTGASYDPATGQVTFTSNDGLGFATGDIRGANGSDGIDGDGFTGGTYDATTGEVTFTSNDGLGFSTGNLRGAAGDQGPQGIAGEDADGFTGGYYSNSTGRVFFTSNDGLSFSTDDLRGATGPQGQIGNTGPQGETGDTGAQGPVGNTGPQGQIGNTGPQGPIGNTGAQGPVGNTGPQGQIGNTGPQGETGDTGAQGPVGNTGPQGPIGNTGAQGSTGPQGPVGPSAATDLSYTASARTINSSTGTNTTLPNVVAGGNSGLMTGADKTKLNGIETGATADQTAAEILTAIKTVDGSGSGLDADRVDNLQASSFIRADANDDVAGHTEWQDNYEIRLGTSADFRMDFDGTDTIFRSYPSANGDIKFQGANSAGTNQNLIILDTSDLRGHVRLFENNTEKLKTTLSGVSVTGTATATAFAGDGGSITGINASNISSGTIPDDHIPDTITPATLVKTKEIRTSNGTEVVINAGESAGKISGQTGESVYVNAEGGFEVCTPIGDNANWQGGTAHHRMRLTGAEIQFHNGTTRVGEIGSTDTTWLRINQTTNKNIYTPRYIRADAGFFVDGTAKGINGSGNFFGGTISGASDVSNPSVANTVVKRNASSDINCRLVRPTYQNQSDCSGAIAFRKNNSTDNYIRFCSDTSAIRSFLGVSATAADGNYLKSNASTTYDNGQLNINSNSANGHYWGVGLEYNSGWKHTNASSWGFAFRNSAGILDIYSSKEGGTSGGTATYRTLRVGGSSQLLQYDGHNIWHAGNFTPGSYLRSDANDSFSGNITASGEFYSTGMDTIAESKKVRFGRSTGQYVGFYGNASGNVITSVSTASNPKDLLSFQTSIDSGSTVSKTWTLSGASGTIWHAGNDGAGSGLDADTLDGLQLSTGSRNNVANQVVRTQANGYINAGWINTTSGSHANTVTKVYSTYTTDGYIRYCTPNHLANSMGNVLHSDASDQFDGQVSGRKLTFRCVDGRNAASSSGGLFPLEVYQASNTTNSDAAMTFHIGGRHATYFGLNRETNDLFVGGWSKGPNKYKIFHEGNTISSGSIVRTSISNVFEINRYVDFHTSTSSANDYDFRLDNNQAGNLKFSGRIQTRANSNTESILVDRSQSYSAQLLIGGWSSSNSNDIARIRCSSNLHLDSPKNGDMFLNWYSQNCINWKGELLAGANARIRLDSLGTASSPSLSFSGDTNTGIYETGSDKIAFTTGGSLRGFMNNGNFTYAGIYSNTQAGGTNVRVDSAGRLRRHSSSRKTKTNIEPMQVEYANTILDQVEPIWYRPRIPDPNYPQEYLDNLGDNAPSHEACASYCLDNEIEWDQTDLWMNEGCRPDWSYWGFIAEDLAKIDPRLCSQNPETGEYDSVQYEEFTPLLLKIAQEQKSQIQTLEQRLNALEDKFNGCVTCNPSV